MSAQPQPGGLSQAQNRIAGILRELSETVESVEELTHRDPASALRLVEDQRAKLYAFVDGIAADVAAPTPAWQRIRRSASALAVAATLLVSSIALAAVVAVSRDRAPDATGLDAVRARMTAARATPDLAERLAHLAEAARLAAALPPQVSEDADIADDLATMLDHTRDEIERNDDTLIERATEVATKDPGSSDGPAPNPQRDPDDPITSITDVAPPDVDDPSTDTPAPK